MLGRPRASADFVELAGSDTITGAKNRGNVVAVLFMATRTVVCQGMGGGKEKLLRHLLSDEVWGVGRLHLEGAVLSPQVNRVGDASTASLVDLR